MFSFTSAFLMVSASIFPNICKFPFVRAFWFFLDLVVLFFQSFVVFHFSLWAWHNFSKPDSIPISSLYILTASIRVSNSFSFLAVWCTLGGWFFLAIYEFCILLSVFLVCDPKASSLLQMVYDDIDSPWKTSLFFSSCCQFHIPVFFCIPDKPYHFAKCLVHCETVYYPALRDHIIYFFEVTPRNR